MDFDVPVIQVLSRSNYEDHHVVALPTALPLPPLGPSSFRIKTNIFSLTINNLSYARVGHLFGWWDVHPLPPSIPAGFSDPMKFGRISCWGYGLVIESTVPEISVGARVFGYLPIGTLPVDMNIKLNPEVKEQFLEISKQRQKLLPIYNLYQLSERDKIANKEDQGLDALMEVLFLTGYLMNRFLFPWDPTEIVHGSALNDGWSLEKGSLGDNSVVLLFSTSTKTALLFAYLLKNGRSKDKPLLVVGIGSQVSKAFTEGTGFYDKILTYDDDSGDFELKLGLKPESKIVVCDFGARDGACDRWGEKLRSSGREIINLRVVGEVVAERPEKMTELVMNTI